jgi:hypothetical protein
MVSNLLLFLFLLVRLFLLLLVRLFLLLLVDPKDMPPAFFLRRRRRRRRCCRGSRLDYVNQISFQRSEYKVLESWYSIGIVVIGIVGIVVAFRLVFLHNVVEIDNCGGSCGWFSTKALIGLEGSKVSDGLHFGIHVESFDPNILIMWNGRRMNGSALGWFVG